MGVSLEQWRSAIGSFSASIKACDLPHCSVALCHVDTLFSVLWFVATISLQSMKTALMLLILLSGDVERNPGPDVMKCTPGLPELLNFKAKSGKINIACEMSVSWRSVGIALLNDASGATVSALHRSNFHDIGDTSIAILTKWVRGSGIDRSWQGLLGVLDVYCQALAAEIRDTLSSRQPLKEGFVNLRVPGWLWGHNWKRKWMILRKDQLLCFQDGSTKADSNVEETQYVQDATDAYNVPADWRTWPETAFKGKCCFIVNVSEAAEPYFVVAKDEADKREWMEGIRSFQKEQEEPAVAIDDHVVKDGAVGACGGDVRKKVTHGEPGGRGKTYDIFLSYKHETVSMKCAQTVCEHLTGLGHKVYLDERELMGGVNIGKELTAAISEAPIFLPILSSEYMTKGGELWCQRELDFAKYKERELLPVVIKGVEIPDDVMLTIGPSTMRLEYDPFDPSTGIASIARAVGRLLAKQPDSHASPVGKGALSDVQDNEGPVLAASVPHSDSMPSISKSLEIVACPSPSLQEEGKKKTCQPVVLAYWYWITKYVKPEALLPYVMKYNLLEPQHHAEITKLTTSGQRTNAIIVSGILYKGEKELEEFIASLEEEPDHSEHQTLVRMLKEGLSGKPAPLPSESSSPTVQRIIYPHMPAVIRGMDSKELETHLVQHGLVTDYDIEYLRNPNQTQTDRNHFVISLLWSCGDKAVEIFIRCLIKATTHRAHKELVCLLIQQLRQENYEELAEALEHVFLSADSPAKACGGSPSGEKDLTGLSADSPPPDIISGPSAGGMELSVDPPPPVIISGPLDEDAEKDK